MIWERNRDLICHQMKAKTLHALTITKRASANIQFIVLFHVFAASLRFWAFYVIVNIFSFYCLNLLTFDRSLKKLSIKTSVNLKNHLG